VSVEPEEWTFQVSDNGIGFDSCYAQRIFEPFKRLHNRADYSGTGLGLATCKKLVERHGGRIWAQSEPGHGADCFSTLPGLRYKKTAASRGIIGMHNAGRRQ
jgi:signal transduction histidine kinase